DDASDASTEEEEDQNYDELDATEEEDQNDTPPSTPKLRRGYNLGEHLEKELGKLDTKARRLRMAELRSLDKLSLQIEENKARNRSLIDGLNLQAAMDNLTELMSHGQGKGKGKGKKGQGKGKMQGKGKGKEKEIRRSSRVKKIVQEDEEEGEEEGEEEDEDVVQEKPDSKGKGKAKEVVSEDEAESEEEEVKKKGRKEKQKGKEEKKEKSKPVPPPSGHKMFIELPLSPRHARLRPRPRPLFRPEPPVPAHSQGAVQDGSLPKTPTEATAPSGDAMDVDLPEYLVNLPRPIKTAPLLDDLRSLIIKLPLSVPEAGKESPWVQFEGDAWAIIPPSEDAWEQWNGILDTCLQVLPGQSLEDFEEKTVLRGPNGTAALYRALVYVSDHVVFDPDMLEGKLKRVITAIEKKCPDIRRQDVHPVTPPPPISDPLPASDAANPPPPLSPTRPATRPVQSEVEQPAPSQSPPPSTRLAHSEDEQPAPSQLPPPSTLPAQSKDEQPVLSQLPPPSTPPAQSKDEQPVPPQPPLPSTPPVQSEDEQAAPSQPPPPSTRPAQSADEQLVLSQPPIAVLPPASPHPTLAVADSAPPTPGSSKRPFSPEKASFSSKVPSWLSTMKTYLLQDLEAKEGAWKPAWEGAVESLVSLEASYRFQDSRKSLPTGSRPNAIHAWVKNARKDHLPRVKNINLFRGGIKILNQGAKRALEIPKRGLQGAKSGDGEGYNSQMRTTCSLDQNARNSVKAGNSMKEGLNAWAQRVLTSKSTTAGLCANPEVKYNKSGEVEKTNEADRMYIKRISWGESDSKDSKMSREIEKCFCYITLEKNNVFMRVLFQDIIPANGIIVDRFQKNASVSYLRRQTNGKPYFTTPIGEAWTLLSDCLLLMVNIKYFLPASGVSHELSPTSLYWAVPASMTNIVSNTATAEDDVKLKVLQEEPPTKSSLNFKISSSSSQHQVVKSHPSIQRHRKAIKACLEVGRLVEQRKRVKATGIERKLKSFKAIYQQRVYQPSNVIQAERMQRWTGLTGGARREQKTQGSNTMGRNRMEDDNEDMECLENAGATADNKEEHCMKIKTTKENPYRLQNLYAARSSEQCGRNRG
ncbi:hypothetical protein K435DRAFT_790165, partial [Dendrothele bispora CBS 962.96]